MIMKKRGKNTYWRDTEDNFNHRFENKCICYILRCKILTWLRHDILCILRTLPTNKPLFTPCPNLKVRTFEFTFCNNMSLQITTTRKNKIKKLKKNTTHSKAHQDNTTTPYPHMHGLGMVNGHRMSIVYTLTSLLFSHRSPIPERVGVNSSYRKLYLVSSITF